jgi:hypothetical protein
LFSGEDQSLLVRRNSFLVLDFGLHVFNPIGWFDFEGDMFSSQCLDEDLHFANEVTLSLAVEWKIWV